MYQKQTQRIFTEQDFRQLLINRSDIERALDLKIELQKNNDEQYLEDYALFPEINLHDVVCIFLDMHPEYINATQHPRYNVIYYAISQQAEKGLIKSTIEYDINGNVTAIFIPHSTARNIANSRGYKWNVPPYNPIIADSLNTDRERTSNDKNQAMLELKNENERLKEQIANLKTTNAGDEKVSNTDVTIYGHSSEGIEILFEICKKISEKCDPDNPHSYPTKKYIEEYVKRYFTDSSKLSEAIYQIAIPNAVKSRGRTPQGVETFQGFI